MSQIFPFSSAELTTWIERPDLSIADRQILNDGKRLTANHISAVHYILRAKFPTRTGLQDTHYHRILKEWKSDPKEFVQILYVDSEHWVCLSNIDCEDGCVELYDSMTTLPPEDGSIVKQVCTVLKSLKLDVVTIKVINVQQQVGGTDCGLFATAMATNLCLGFDPHRARYAQDQLRCHLDKCFQSGTMTQFPSTDSPLPVDTKRVWFAVSFEIHCICRQPEAFKFMICCDGCNLWFHEQCVKQKEVDLDYSDQWLCSSCIYLRKLNSYM